MALFPTTPDMGATSRDKLIGTLHLSFAALLFLTLAYFSLALFTKTAPDKKPTRRKLHRNTVYRVCGYTILASIFLRSSSHYQQSKPFLSGLLQYFGLSPLR
ncbi:MAG: hypothetical protein AUG89_01875 [Acidobacteria bacterium 13_1_20CM_4_56_7]|nr:MAG: hypothetical protein AUG89_01875 [Acidobacteria bacterium 13_1_20CM_4_56_7]